MSEVEDRIKRIEQHKGVKGILIVTSENKFIKSTMPQNNEANKYGVMLKNLAIQARDLVRDLDPSNDLTFLRVTCKKYEMMIAPDKDYYLIVIQCPNEEE